MGSKKPRLGPLNRFEAHLNVVRGEGFEPFRRAWPDLEPLRDRRLRPAPPRAARPLWPGLATPAGIHRYFRKGGNLYICRPSPCPDPPKASSGRRTAI